MKSSEKIGECLEACKWVCPVICLFALKSILSFLVLVYMTKVDAANSIRCAPLLSGYFMSLPNGMHGQKIGESEAETGQDNFLSASGGSVGGSSVSSLALASTG